MTLGKVIVNDLTSLLDILPADIRKGLDEHPQLPELLEIVLDLGRPAIARFRNGEFRPSQTEVTSEDIASVTGQIGTFGDDNRAGIERTLHRISCLRNRSGKIVGLTCRVGRAVFGTIKIIEDLVFSDQSILLLGGPGVGKTTMLREIARVLADDSHRRVVVVDTSNEIAGDGDIPHPGIGDARRMQVPTPTLQHQVMIEAVENHMPEVIIIDEMGTELETTAARTIAERGVQLIATAHGNTLDNLVLNPTLCDLIGGIHTVTLGDDEARRRGTQKSVLERKAPPTFSSVVEIQGWDQVAIHANTAVEVDALLRGFSVTPERRWIDKDAEVHKATGSPITLRHTPEQLPSYTPQPFQSNTQRTKHTNGTGGIAVNFPTPNQLPLTQSNGPPKPTRIFSYGVSKDRLHDFIDKLGIGAVVTTSVEASDVVLTTKLQYRNKSAPLRFAEEHNRPIHVLRRNTPVQIEQFLKNISISWRDSEDSSPEDGLQEAEDAVQQLMDGEGSVELSPQTAYIRRLQHILAERYNLASASTGKDRKRRVIIFRR